MSEKMNILLVDDRGHIDLGDGRFPSMRGVLEKHFNIIWLSNAYEGRWLLDAVDELHSFAALKLLDVGIPPEIMIFDYALSQSRDKSYDRKDDPTCIFAYLSNLMQQTSPDIPLRSKDYEIIPDTGSEQGKDRMGCYIGVELSRLFSNYPCGAIPTTAHIDVRGTDAAFYEWLNERYLNYAFAEKNNASPMWGPLVKSGVEQCRNRMVQLTRSGLLVPSLAQLQYLIENPINSLGEQEDGVFQGTIDFRSYYGKRAILISSLFFEKLYESGKLESYSDGTAEVSVESFEKSAKEWAGLMLDALFKTKHGFNEYQEASDLADLYFTAFISDQHDDRYWLAENILLSSNLQENESINDKLKAYSLNLKRIKNIKNKTFQKTFESVCVKLNIDSDTKDVLKFINQSQFYTLPPLYRAVKNKPVVIRWAILMLMVKTVHYNQQNGAGTILNLTEVCEMIDPLPEHFLTFKRHYDKGPANIQNSLKNLGDGLEGWHSWGLSINDVLESKFNLGNGNHGLFPHELFFLRSYANDLGFYEGCWPGWLRQGCG
ncbi:MAG: hypothetical protein JXR78_14165 [Victivallales bacterium]|nr:hypothetical protein [Victivallales bacterium]